MKVIENKQEIIIFWFKFYSILCTTFARVWVQQKHNTIQIIFLTQKFMYKKEQQYQLTLLDEGSIYITKTRFSVSTYKLHFHSIKSGQSRTDIWHWGSICTAKPSSESINQVRAIIEVTSWKAKTLL